MRWRRYFQRGRRDDDLAREIAHYVAQETDDNLARGMAPDQARTAALRKFGNPQVIREAVYRTNTINWLEVVLQDLKHGLRQLRRRPSFAITAMASLAIGLGANAAIFRLVDQLLLRLLPVERPQELVQLRVDGLRPGGNWGDGRHTFPYPTYAALRDRNTVFTGVTGQRIEPVSLVDDDRSGTVTIAFVAANYFDVLGVRPHLGRTLTPDDERPAAGPAAVLQFDFWRSYFQGRPGIVGETIRLNGQPVVVVGVAAAAFAGTNVGTPTKIFVPITLQAAMLPTNPRLDDERAAWFYPFARLKPGVDRPQAEAAMKVLYRQRHQEELGRSYFSRNPETRAPFLEQTFTLEPAARGESGLRSRFEQPLVLLEWLAAAVLLIACANIAGLLLARGAAGQREIAIRRAIGASRARVVSHLFAESVVLAAVSSVAALFLASWMTQFLIALLPVNADDLSLSATPDLRVVAFTAAVTAVTAGLFGLLPAWQNSRVPLAATMREESGAIAGARPQVRARKAFVAIQIGLSVVLLLGAGLFVRTLDNLQRVELGVNTEGVVTFFARPAVALENARKAQVYRTFLEGLQAVPGVIAIGANVSPLFTGARSDGPLAIEGPVTGAEGPYSLFNGVTPGYFEALGIPLHAGRAMTWDDWGTGKRIAFVNEAVASAFFQGSSPLGRRVGRGTRAPTEFEVVGVVGNNRHHDLRGDLPPQTFFNLDSRVEGISRISVYARAAGDPRQAMASLRAAAHRIDPNMVVSSMRTLEEQLDTQMANEKMLSFLSTGFAVLATILAIVGVYGVLVFQVARRTREIGVRMALGARRGPIVRLVAGEMLYVVLGGLAAGLVVAFLCGRYVQSQLFGLEADDPLVYATAVGLILSGAIAATLIPAWRASRIDAVDALRHE